MAARAGANARHAREVAAARALTRRDARHDTDDDIGAVFGTIRNDDAVGDAAGARGGAVDLGRLGPKDATRCASVERVDDGTEVRGRARERVRAARGRAKAKRAPIASATSTPPLVRVLVVELAKKPTS